MADSLEALEARLAELQAEILAAARVGDTIAMKRLRRQRREAQDAWDALAEQEAGQATPVTGRQPLSSPTAAPPRSVGTKPGRGTPIREQAHQALTILDAPAGPQLIAATHAAFLSEPVVTTRLGSLRRDEERSFAAQPFARPYYIVPALNHDWLTPVRGLLAVSTWPLERRMLGPLGPRTDFLSHARRIAEQVIRIQDAGLEPDPAAWRLLRSFALNIPGAYEGYGEPDPKRVALAAAAEAEVHTDADQSERRSAARRARNQLTDPVRLLFGASPAANVGTSQAQNT
ncbi:hypothetical protein ACEZDB_28065 [Streptacidiphilus sp. N1-3]|uniref:Uncharacterized protein n=1 Tax=Streptacidiphilus alkalitolerans TaxID=3342712 RepID=A0ABV6X8F0_9ACTN